MTIWEHLCASFIALPVAQMKGISTEAMKTSTMRHIGTGAYPAKGMTQFCSARSSFEENTFLEWNEEF